MNTETKLMKRLATADGMYVQTFHKAQGGRYSSYQKPCFMLTSNVADAKVFTPRSASVAQGILVRFGTRTTAQDVPVEVAIASQQPGAELIAAAVQPLKSEAVRRAANHAQSIIEQVKKELAAAGNDMNTAAPYPSVNLPRPKYIAASLKYKTFAALTVGREGQLNHGMRGPRLVDICAKDCAKFIKDAEKNAAAQYELFVAKLQSKIGPVTYAYLEGNHVWSYSELSVVPVGRATAEVWRTRMIVNQSKLGTVFNQFPTRKVKS